VGPSLLEAAVEGGVAFPLVLAVAGVAPAEASQAAVGTALDVLTFDAAEATVALDPLLLAAMGVAPGATLTLHSVPVAGQQRPPQHPQLALPSPRDPARAPLGPPATLALRPVAALTLLPLRPRAWAALGAQQRAVLEAGFAGVRTVARGAVLCFPHAGETHPLVVADAVGQPATGEAGDGDDDAVLSARLHFLAAQIQPDAQTAAAVAPGAPGPAPRQVWVAQAAAPVHVADPDPAHVAALLAYERARRALVMALAGRPEQPDPAPADAAAALLHPAAALSLPLARADWWDVDAGSAQPDTLTDAAGAAPPATADYDNAPWPAPAASLAPAADGSLAVFLRCSALPRAEHGPWRPFPRHAAHSQYRIRVPLTPALAAAPRVAVAMHTSKAQPVAGAAPTDAAPAPDAYLALDGPAAASRHLLALLAGEPRAEAALPDLELPPSPDDGEPALHLFIAVAAEAPLTATLTVELKPALDNAATAFPAAPTPASSSAAPAAPAAPTCEHCGEQVPANLALHQARCRRLRVPCPACGRPQPPARLQRHRDLCHAPVACRCGAALDPAHVPGHTLAACPLRPVPCPWCPLSTPAHLADAHARACALTPAACGQCGHQGQRRQMRHHLSSQHGLPLPSIRKHMWS
jgi:hypothetical protein